MTKLGRKSNGGVCTTQLMCQERLQSIRGQHRKRSWPTVGETCIWCGGHRVCGWKKSKSLTSKMEIKFENSSSCTKITFCRREDELKESVKRGGSGCPWRAGSEHTLWALRLFLPGILSNANFSSSPLGPFQANKPTPRWCWSSHPPLPHRAEPSLPFSTALQKLPVLARDSGLICGAHEALLKNTQNSFLLSF